MENIAKKFGDHDVLRGINLELSNGVFGLLGPNGAGKTTFIRLLIGLMKPDQGKILIDHQDSQNAHYRANILSKLGYLPQTFDVLPRVTSIEYLTFLSRLYQGSIKLNHNRIRELLESVNLWQHRRIPLAKYSGGMKRRFGIAQALLNDPPFLIVDEPTAGLDPEERVTFRNILSDLPYDRLVLLSTHIVEDIEIACNRLIILEQGKIGFDSTPSDLFTRMMPFIWEKRIPISMADIYFHNEQVISMNIAEDEYAVRIAAVEKPPEFEATQPTFEDVYICWLHRAKLGLKT
ncbi:ATP-binding cassette domain-containing protein [candidate division CSSED10-310 bacterium]|uniref:ATP-binding cassette domain-containing protein n=1 Tax=candidate division CSSED10-310 bacterium TaxID=2855610 RepID=A0ABV6YSB8_UNCC1